LLPGLRNSLILVEGVSRPADVLKIGQATQESHQEFQDSGVWAVFVRLLVQKGTLWMA
jgi:hypothetical protein